MLKGLGVPQVLVRMKPSPARATVETSGSDGEVFETRSRDANARRAVGVRERMGSDAATVITIGARCPAHTSRRPRKRRW
jgi:hypothetical protein